MEVYRYLRAEPDDIRAGGRLRGIPASGQLVFGAIRDNGPMSHADLRDATGLPARTIRYGLRRLKDEGLVDSRPSLRDSRICYFFIHPDLVAPDALERRRREAEQAAGVVLPAGRLRGIPAPAMECRRPHG